MSDVPDEILRDILSRLPVAPLLRFRCVSKSWKCLIDNQQFIKQHLNHSRKTNSNLNIIFNSARHLWSADFDLLIETNMANFQELTHPLEAADGRTEILGSCDGLLVLRNDKDDHTILWNPSVRRFHVIPSSGIDFPGSPTDWNCVVYGFGYDVVSDDYKLVRIVLLYGNGKDDFKSEVKVYSLKSGSWRKIPDFPYHIKFKRANVLANGALHWVVGREGLWNINGLIAAFDLGTELHRLMPLPKLSSNDFFLILGVVVGCLSVMHYNVNKDQVEIWVMKEYGVQESWSILFRFDTCYFRCMTALAHSGCGRKVLLGLYDQGLAWYDLDEKSTTDDVPMVQRPSEKIRNMCTCVQSLVLLNNGTCDFDLVTKKKQERND